MASAPTLISANLDWNDGLSLNYGSAYRHIMFITPNQSVPET